MIGAEPPAYDEPTSLSRPHPKVLPKMSFHSTAAQLVTLASEGGEHGGGNHESLEPLVTGGAAFVILMLLLWVTTRFNRDR